MNHHILLNSLRNSMTALGIAGTLGYFAGSRPFAACLGALLITASVAGFYFAELKFRELRLKKGWYL